MTTRPAPPAPETGFGGGPADHVPRGQAIPAEHARLLRLATRAAVATACLLIAMKFGAWLATGAVSLLSTLMDSVLDAMASIVNLLAVRHALQPADREHRFGHGKAEPLAALAQAAFVAGAALLVVIEAGRRFAQPQPVENAPIGIAVVLVSIILTLALVAFQRYVIRRTRSVAITADSLHYAGDLLLNAAVIVSLVLSMLVEWPLVDPLFGAAIAAWILFSAWRIARVSLDMLMDREMPDEDRARIRSIALAHPEVHNVHDLRTRSSGPHQFIQMHIEMDPQMTLLHAHAISDTVEAEIHAAFPQAEIIIHQDPEGVEQPYATPPGLAGRP